MNSGELTSSKEILQIVSLGEAGELAEVVESNVNEAFDTVTRQIGDKHVVLCARAALLLALPLAVALLFMGLLDGKRIVITGVLTDASLAFGVAELALEQGAEIVLTGAGRGLRLTERSARKLGDGIAVVEFDVTEPSHADSLRDFLDGHWGRVNGALHAIGFAPEICLGGTFMDAAWTDVKVALEISTYSLKRLADAVAPLMGASEADSADADGGSRGSGGSIVGLDFDASRAFPAYDWMGVAKAGLESTCRYLARYLGPQGIRVNLVSAGPIKTMAARSIPGFSEFEDAWTQRAPLGWSITESGAVSRTVVAMLSDWLPATTGSIVQADGGFHAVGA